MASASLYHELRLQYKRSRDGQLLEHVSHHGGTHAIALYQISQVALASNTPPLDLKITSWRFTFNSLVIRNISGLTGSSVPARSAVNRNSKVKSPLASVEAICIPKSKRDHFRVNLQPDTVREVSSSKKHHDFILHVCEMDFTTHVSGLLLFQTQPAIYPLSNASENAGSCRSLHDSSGDIDFRKYFALVLLCQHSSRLTPPSSHPKKTLTFNNSLAAAATIEAYVDKICDLFEARLLFRAPENDQWDKGHHLFREKVKHFVANRQEIRFCLPAFPCKSSNPEKVASIWPDGAEYEALTNLHKFCVDTESIYPPGCVMEIVSDGHVFSDCVGVDDEVVSEYTQRLQSMSRSIHCQVRNDQLSKMRDPVTFQGLHEILFPTEWMRFFFKIHYAKMAALNHPVRTKIAPEEDICRGVLLHACGACSANLRKVIEQDPDSSLTMLYRGFSRFMLDDLRTHADGRDKSKNQRKKLSERVALEMMQRNQAYSHLVEMVMPRHVRLSIHAHNNAGPKFAVSLLPKDKFKSLTSFDGIRVASKDDHYDERHHLHIPTPWHNALVVIEARKTGFMCKAGLVKTELAGNNNLWSSTSGYVAGHPRGGRFVLQRGQKPSGAQVEAPETVDTLLSG